MSGHGVLLQLINQAIEESSSALRVCMPGRIEKYDPETMLANIQPLLKIKFYGRTDSQLLPIINNVPICHTRTGTALIRLPVALGDIVTIVFADRSIESWISGNGEARDPLDTRKHHITDAFAFLGGYPQGLKQTANNKNALEIVVKSGTKLTIGNGEEELLQLAHNAFTGLKTLTEQLAQTLADIQLITHPYTDDGVPSTTGVPDNAADFATIKTSVDAITTQVQTTLTDLEKIKV